MLARARLNVTLRHYTILCWTGRFWRKADKYFRRAFEKKLRKSLGSGHAAEDQE
jgi:hypothetical protein